MPLKWNNFRKSESVRPDSARRLINEKIFQTRVALSDEIRARQSSQNKNTSAPATRRAERLQHESSRKTTIGGH
ncbi:unnamed protein product [Trichogramma brassicae]|uniref:Uncharacterized protein n=1 Tax=Trichogramma brassicae TaxID=86971 RepID=A0A6H5I099_9HYME|nr:unnamed protein product [Trichogramma brassicae]